MKRNDPCNQPILVNVNRNSRPSGNISRIQEQNRSKRIRLCSYVLKIGKTKTYD